MSSSTVCPKPAKSKVQIKYKCKPMSNKKIGALWSKKTTESREYFAGVISDLRGDIQIVVFKNDKKENQNQPDYNILLSEPKKEEK